LVAILGHPQIFQLTGVVYLVLAQLMDQLQVFSLDTMGALDIFEQQQDVL
jgi:hypothetical protein